MNEVLKAIFERRSIRKYLDKPISDEDLNLILTAGLYAPNAKNKQPWHLTALCSPSAISILNQALKEASQKPGFDHYAGFVGQGSYSLNYGGAPLVVLVSAPEADLAMLAPSDCALVMQNMFLAAHSLGIGSCWINQLHPVSNEPGFRKVLTSLGVPAANNIYATAIFGYNAGDHPAPPARKDGTLNIVR